MRWIAVPLALLLTLETAPRLAAQENAAGKLNLVIVEGEGAINNIRQRTARAPIVQVEDENHRPVAGAAVTFMLPQRGATGVFSNGSRSITVMTNSEGRATASGIRPGNVPGQMQINVSASYQGMTASAVVTQTNMMAAAAAGAAATAGGVLGKSLAVKLLIVAAVAGAGAATGAVIATRGGNTPASVTPPVSISPGTGSVGAPR